MPTLEETKTFLRVDGDEEDGLIAGLILTARELVEETLRRKLSEFEEVPESVHQAMLIVVATLYEARQVSKNGKEGVGITDVLDLVRKMLFAYRREKF